MKTKLSLKKKIALNLFSKYRKSSTELHELSYILWESTLRCNLNCIHCGSDCKKESQVKDMPTKDFLRAIDEIIPIVNPNKTMIVFTGGEALLRKDLEACGLELYKRGFPWGIVSNGLLLNEIRIKSLLNNGLRSITVSLDGLENSHNWMRGNSNAYKKVINAIRLLPKQTDIEYDVVTCANQRNLPELHAIKELLLKLGIKKWRIFTIFPIGRAPKNDELLLSGEEFVSLLDFVKQTKKEGQIIIDYGCEGFLGNYEGEVRDNPFFCRAGINIASILADGSITACPNLRSNFVQGNIYKDNFADVWENKFQNMRNREWTKKGICADCDSYKYCNGNGLHLWDGEDGELMLCHLKKINEGKTACNN